MDLRDLDQRALAAAGDIIASITADQLEQPTPCGDWTLTELLSHLVGHNRGFAAAALGLPTNPAVWDDMSPLADPRQAYQDSAAQVTKAFGAADLMDRRIEVYGYGTYSAPVVLGMHFVDFLVHGWDLAASIGADTTLDRELSEAAMGIALRWPTDRPSKAFGVMVPVPADAPVDQRLVAYLGRSPAWAAPRTAARPADPVPNDGL